MARATQKPEQVATLPADLSTFLLADVDRIARVMTRRIAGESSLPSTYRNVAYLRTVTRACREALGVLLRLLHDGRGLRPGDLDHLGGMGAQQAELGVPIEVLLSAYRLAARVVWEEVIGTAVARQELPPATVVTITSQVLEYLDDISGAVGAAYMDTRDRLLRRNERDRDRILQRLLAGDDSPELRHLAAVVDLTVRPPYHVIAMSSPAGVAHLVEEHWRKKDALVTADEGDVSIILLPAHHDAVRAIGDAVSYAQSEHATAIRCAVGPRVETLAEIGPAAQRARDALRVGLLIDPEGSVFDEAEVGLFASLASDPDALGRFAERQLGPLARADTERDRELLATIAAVVAHDSIGAAATALGVHRHTVVYRIGRLRDIGVDVESPGRRNHLWLALQAMKLLS